ncbi:MAG: cation:proton antiporter subunit C [Melioribacteraceae bacterium]|nr:cation:proton antiporter subunit C [Melioribacteraceae bacterium]WKZ69528.1 MAG: cation:proton antiporter subunit C [Melioribacteraceae bacterium]
MFDFIAGHYDYWFIILLLVIGLYGMTVKKNLVKKLIGMTIFQAAIILFYISSAIKVDATVPIIIENLSVENPANYINPLPHALMLTAIVVGVATVGVAFALLILIYKNYKTLDETELIELMK